jgi:exodeoxyribonuclease-3
MGQKIISWNVNGIRAAVKKDFHKSLQAINPDIICLQETKAQDNEVKNALMYIEGYHVYTNSAERKGYSGTAILSRKQPINVQPDIGVKVHDQEGRVLTAEYNAFYLVTVYVPNSGRGLVRLDYRQTWDKAFKRYLKDLEKHKPVIVCGDFNVAHQPIDLARPKSNYNKTAGYTQQEIDGFTRFMKNGFVDTFRYLKPEEIAYTWWSYMFNSRAKNVGWRIDYFLACRQLIENVKESFTLPDVTGSDHCPVGIMLES